MNLQAKIVHSIAVAALLSALAFAARPVCAQSQTPALNWRSSFTTNVDASSWAYKTLAKLHEDGLVGGAGGRYPFLKGEPITRYGAAVLIARSVDITERIEEHETDIQAYLRRTRPRMDRIFLEDLPLLSKLASAFSNELTHLGMDVPVSQRRLDVLEQACRAMEPSFPDVAPTHWASTSIERLRVAGILLGYPDGTFLAKQK